MKKLLLLIVAVVVVIGVGTVAVIAVDSQYGKYQNKKESPVATITQSESEKKMEEVKIAAAAENQSLADEISRLATECQKGEGAYEKLTPFNKTNTEAPVCVAPSTQVFSDNVPGE